MSIPFNTSGPTAQDLYEQPSNYSWCAVGICCVFETKVGLAVYLLGSFQTRRYCPSNISGCVSANLQSTVPDKTFGSNASMRGAIISVEDNHTSSKVTAVPAPQRSFRLEKKLSVCLGRNHSDFTDEGNSRFLVYVSFCAVFPFSSMCWMQKVLLGVFVWPSRGFCGPIVFDSQRLTKSLDIPSSVINKPQTRFIMDFFPLKVTFAARKSESVISFEVRRTELCNIFDEGTCDVVSLVMLLVLANLQVFFP